MLKNQNEVQALKKLKKYFTFMFYWILGTTIFFVVGFIIVIVLAVIFKENKNNDPLLYTLIIYVLMLFILITIYFGIGAKATKYMNKDPISLALYGHQEVFRNPFSLLKKAKVLGKIIDDLSNGSTIKSAKEKYLDKETKQTLD